MTEFQHQLQDEELDFLLKDKGQEAEGPELGSGPDDDRDSPREVLKPTLHGDLSQVNLPDIFQSLVMSQMEGTLQVNSRWKVIYVHHEAGQLRVLLPAEDWLKRMGYRVLGSGIVDSHVLKQAIRHCHKTGDDLAEHLTGSQGTDPEQLRSIRKALEEDAIFELFTQKKGSFAFYADAYPAQDLETRFARCPNFEASTILLEVARRQDEWTVILRQIDDVNEIFRPSESAWIENQDINEIEQALLNQLDGTRSLSDIAGGMLYCLFDVMKAAQTLSVRELIEKVPTEDLFALAEADLSAEQVRRAAYYLNIVSSFRKPLSLEQLEMLADILIRVNRPRDAGKAYSDCADLVVDEQDKLHYLYQAKRLDPRNPATLTKLLDGLADFLAKAPAEEDEEEVEEEFTDPATAEDVPAPADEEAIDPQAALDADADPVTASQPARRKQRRKSNYAQKREDFRDIGLELAELELHREQPEKGLVVLDRLESFGITEWKVVVLRSKILAHLHRNEEAVALLMKLAARFRKQGQVRELTHCLEQVLRVSPNHAKARNELRDLRSAVSRRTRRLLIVGAVGLLLGLVGWIWHGRSQVKDEARILIEQARSLAKGGEAQEGEALKLARQAAGLAEGSAVGQEAQDLVDQIEAERQRRRDEIEKAELMAFESQLLEAKTAFVRGRYALGFRKFLELYTHDVHRKRGTLILQVFRDLQDNLAKELMDELAKAGTEPLPERETLHNKEEQQQALAGLEQRFPDERRTAFRRFLELVRLTIETHHPFFAEEEATTDAAALPGFSEELLGDFTEIDKVREERDKLADIAKLLEAQRNPGVDIAEPIRALDEEDLATLAAAVRGGSPSAQLLVAQEALLLADPVKLALLRILEDLAAYQAILVQDPIKTPPEQIRDQLEERLRSRPLHHRAELEQVERRFQDLLVRSRQREDERTVRIIELRKALQILQDPRADDQERYRNLRELGFARQAFEGRDLKTRIYDFVQIVADILDRNRNALRSSLAELTGISEARGWAALEHEAGVERDQDLLKYLVDPQVQRSAKIARLEALLAFEQGNESFEPAKAELDQLIETYERLGTLHEYLARADGDFETRLEALKDRQLEIEVALAGKNGRLQAIERARRIGKGGAAARYGELLARVEQLEDLLRQDLQQFTHTVQLDKIFKEAQDAFARLDFAKARTNYRYLEKNIPDSDRSMKEEFQQKAELCDKILAVIAEIDACGARGDHMGALVHYRKLVEEWKEIPFFNVVKLPLLVRTTPEGARLLIDGKPSGRTPQTLSMLAESATEIRVELDGFEPVVFPTRSATDSVFDAHLELLPTWTSGIRGTVTCPPLCLKDQDLLLVTDRDGKLHALRLSTGKELWQRRFPSLSGEFDKPLWFGDAIVLVSREGIVRGLSPKDGATRYEIELGEDLLFPVVRLGRELAMTTKSGKVLAMEPRAEARQRQLYASETLRAAPTGDGRSRFFVATTGGSVACISYDGSMVWEQRLDNCGWTSPILAGSRLMVPTTDNHVQALDADTGRPLWNADAGDDLGLGLAWDPDRLYVATRNKELRVFAVRDGNLLTSRKLPAQPTAGPRIWAGGLVLIPLDRRGAHLYRTTEQAEPFCQLAAKQSSEVPMIVVDEDRFLYLANDGRITMLPTAPLRRLLAPGEARPGR